MAAYMTAKKVRELLAQKEFEHALIFFPSGATFLLGRSIDEANHAIDPFNERITKLQSPVQVQLDDGRAAAGAAAEAPEPAAGAEEEPVAAHKLAKAGLSPAGGSKVPGGTGT